VSKSEQDLNMSTELLKRCPLFAGLKEEDLKKIRALASVKQVRKKEILFGQGEEAFTDVDIEEIIRMADEGNT